MRKPYQVPSSFTKERIPLSWTDISWGYTHKKIDWSSVVDLAMDRLHSSSCSASEIELASVGKENTHEIIELLEKLSKEEPEAPGVTPERKWLFLTLAWLFVNKDSFTNSLEIIESIYADFEYPEEISSFVQYMPQDNEQELSTYTPVERKLWLFKQWEKFLLVAEQEILSFEKPLKNR